MDKILKVTGREILNAKGRPTVEAEVETEKGIRAAASVPSGTSRGKYEAFELYDGEKRYNGYGTRKAAGNINGEINGMLAGREVTQQREIDRALCLLDGTPDKSRLGGNGILAVSMAVARAAALSENAPLYEYLREGQQPLKLPDIVATVIAGGVFSNSGMEFEDYMAIFHGFDSFPEELEALVYIRGKLEEELRKKYGNFPEDGGALAAPCGSSAEAFQWIMKIASDAGCKNQVGLGIDAAASELWDGEEKVYRLGKETYSSGQLGDYYKRLSAEYPLTFIEDGFEQDDFASFAALRKSVPQAQIVGDDLFATNVERLRKGIRLGSANGLLLKINQIGTVTEAMEAGKIAQSNGMDVIVSLRSGETCDDFIADLAVAIGARQIKLGSPVRAERNAKYNRLLKIWQELNF